MRKIVVAEFISLDGVVESPEKWHFPYVDQEMMGIIGGSAARSDTLLLGRVTYETFAGAFAVNVWMLAAFRLLAGVGIGGEWSMGGTFIAEELPESRRKMAAGLMHTGYYVGIFLAAIANYFVGARYGWRAGALPRPKPDRKYRSASPARAKRAGGGGGCSTQAACGRSVRKPEGVLKSPHEPE